MTGRSAADAASGLRPSGAEPAAQSQAEPLVPNAWRCGHPRTLENTKRVRNGTGTACLICFRLANRAYMRRVRATTRVNADHIVGMLSLQQREAVLALGASPSRLGTRAGRETNIRLMAIKTCPYPLFERTWGGDANRHNLTQLGLSVRAAIVLHPLDGPMAAEVGK